MSTLRCNPRSISISVIPTESIESRVPPEGGGGGAPLRNGDFFADKKDNFPFLPSSVLKKGQMMARKRTGKSPDLSMIAEGLRPLAVPIDTLIPDPRNARLHGERNLSAIVASYRAFGQQKNIVAVEGTNIVIAGNGQLAAAKTLGFTHLAVSFFPDEASARAFALADNRTSEMDVSWDPEFLRQSLGEIRDLDMDMDELGFGAEDLDTLLPQSDQTPAVGDQQKTATITADEVPTPPEKAITQQGDLWLLGRHRLLCGEITHAVEDVSQLIVAAEQTGRTCVATEISPPQCDVAVKRWETLTGEQATCIRARAV